MKNLSRIAHDLIFGGPSESLCSHAWGLREMSRFWKLWVMVFGERHCRASFHFHRNIDIHGESVTDEETSKGGRSVRQQEEIQRGR